MNDQTTPAPRLEDFVESLLREKNLPGITEDALSSLVQETTSQLRELIDMAVIDAMSPQRQDDLNMLLSDPNTTTVGVSDFISQSGVDVAKVTTDTMTHFRELYLQGPEIAS